ncbi:MAG: cellulose biosynthesis cyclic di-GMP-binding regulatory protein BcsB [Janthinobacterium lividum]
MNKRARGAQVVTRSQGWTGKRAYLWLAALAVSAFLLVPRAGHAAPAPLAAPAAGLQSTDTSANAGLATPLGALASPLAAGAGTTPADRTRVPTTSDQGEPLPNGGRRYTLNFRQLGSLYPLELRGVDGTIGVPFSVRSDEVVTGARLHLNYSYSPALITNMSHLKISVNGEVAATVPLAKEQAGILLSRDIPIEPRLITDFNQLNVQLIGHYTMECEDPLNSTLWANVGNDSSLELTVAPLPTGNDLASLPLPFFDRRDVRRLELPFVFGAAPSQQTLEAAGIVSSWLGSLAGYRGALFPALLSQAPQTGNAVVFATSDERPAGLTLPPIQGPSLSVVNNPADPRGKLLLVMGRDTHELKTAAMALGIGQSALSGQSAVIGSLTDVKAREPYDAPAWVRSDRPVRFGELADQKDLNVSGYNPDLVRVNLRMPPDLFAWRSNGIPIDLLYRYTPRPSADKSTLNISVNNNFVTSLRIPTYAAGSLMPSALSNTLAADGSAAREAKIRIQPFLLPSTSQLQFHYYYDYVKNGACKDVLLDNVRGAIDPDSTIDLSSFAHYMALPDLAAFSNSGFPFTRMADLSQSAVILPDAPRAADISLYLALMGRMGGSTGYPVTGVSVGRATDAHNFADKDLLVIGAPENQALFHDWAKSMPFSSNAGGSSIDLSDLAFRVYDWWHGDRGMERAPRSATLSLTSQMSDAVIMGFQSPLNSSRSVVALAGSGPQNMSDLLSALMDAELVGQIQGGLTVVHGRSVSSIASGNAYYVGSLPPLTYLRWMMSVHPLLLVLCALVVALIIAMVLFRLLRGIAAKRLQK